MTMLNWSYIFKQLLWLTYFLYTSCFIPQLFTNYRRKSTDGLSSYAIGIYFFGYFVENLYIYLLDLPFALKVMIPFGTLVGGALVVQKLYYEKNINRRWRMIVVYAIGIFIVGLAAFMGHSYPYEVGHAAGWTASACWLVFQIPQVKKLIARRSVEGFNFWFIIIGTTAATTMVLAALIIPLPLQNLFDGMRGLVFNAIIVYQFYRFHPDPWYRWLV